ncbi:MAG: hypothetical protein WC357_02535 [Candidatus Omnitrophota bacterium]|jgi:hypothetical protein
MEITIPSRHSKAIHPTFVFKEAWGICRNNLNKLGVIYLIFNLPIAVIYLTPMANKLQNQKASLPEAICILLPVLLLSSWGHIALLLGAKKAADPEDYSVGQSISQAKPFFLNYLGTVLISTLFLTGIMMLGGISITVILALLFKINKMLAVSICLVVAIAAIMPFIYFMLRWSFATTVCVLENVRPVAALKRSLSLAMDYIHPIVGTYCLFLLVYVICLILIIIAGVFLGAGSDAGHSNWLGAVFSIFINIVLMPFWTIITVILYKKLKEALETHVYA